MARATGVSGELYILTFVPSNLTRQTERFPIYFTHLSRKEPWGRWLEEPSVCQILKQANQILFYRQWSQSVTAEGWRLVHGMTPDMRHRHAVNRDAPRFVTKLLPKADLEYLCYSGSSFLYFGTTCLRRWGLQNQRLLLNQVLKLIFIDLLLCDDASLLSVFLLFIYSFIHLLIYICNCVYIFVFLSFEYFVDMSALLSKNFVNLFF